MKHHHQVLSVLFLSLLVSISYTKSHEVEYEPHSVGANDHRTHRHHNRIRHRSGKRVGHRMRGRRFKTESPFGQYDENDYEYAGQHGPAVNITAKVGDSVILACSVNSSYGLNPGVNIFCLFVIGSLGAGV